MYHFWDNFGLHLGVILGAQFATILLFGRPSRQPGPKIGTCFGRSFLCGFSGPPPPTPRKRVGGMGGAPKSADPRGVIRRVRDVLCPLLLSSPWACKKYVWLRPPPGTSWDQASQSVPVFVSFFGPSFWRLFCPPGRHKGSIVVNLAPKMTSKWSPKWSRSDEGRPSRNMRRRERIACPPPPGELRVRSFFRDRQKGTQKVT